MDLFTPEPVRKAAAEYQKWERLERAAPHGRVLSRRAKKAKALHALLEAEMETRGTMG